MDRSIHKPGMLTELLRAPTMSGDSLTLTLDRLGFSVLG